MADLEFLDRVWNRGKIESLLFGRVIAEKDDHGNIIDADAPVTSWYQLRCRAYDRGDVNAVHDAIQFERVVFSIDDPQQRAAVMLAMMGWEFAEIGSAIRSKLTGRQLVKAGIRSMVAAERRRGELRDGQGVRK